MADNGNHSRDSDEKNVSDPDWFVAQVTEELISPTELSQRHPGVSISAIRKWVKAAGKNLPSRYKS